MPPEPVPSRSVLAQRQDSTHDQIQTVIGLAEAAGCYDAADWIKSTWSPKCSLCLGRGFVQRWTQIEGVTGVGMGSITQRPCDECNGTGRRG